MRLFGVSALLVSLLVPFAAAFFDDIDRIEWNLENSPTDLSTILETLRTQEQGMFRDVSKTAWYTPYVASVAVQGIIRGDIDPVTGKAVGTFRPGSSVTIAETVKLAVKAAKIDESECTAAARHPDALTHWSKTYIACAEAKNARVLQDLPPLDRPATRAEVLALFDDIAGEQVPTLLAPYSDTLMNRYQDDIAFNTALGVVSGYLNTDGSSRFLFGPDSPVTRAEVAKITYNRLQIVPAALSL